MFKATEVERKMREINLLIYLQINISSCKTLDHYFLLSLQRLLCGLVRDQKCIIDARPKFIKGKQMAAEKTWQKSHRVYPLKIIQISSLGRLQEILLEHHDCSYVVSY